MGSDWSSGANPERKVSGKNRFEAIGAAAFGFALARTIPYGVLLTLEAKAAATIKLLEARQEELRAAWGDAVAEEANRLAARAARAIERRAAGKG